MVKFPVKKVEEKALSVTVLALHLFQLLSGADNDEDAGEINQKLKYCTTKTQLKSRRRGGGDE